MGFGRSQFKPRKKTEEEKQDGFWYIRRKIQVHAHDFMAWLHNRQTPPLLPPPSAGRAGFDAREYDYAHKLDLHHFLQSHANDAMVVPLQHGYHLWMHDNPEFLRQQQDRDLYPLWAAFTFWSYIYRDKDDQPGTAQDFATWVLEKLAEDSEE
jgi:hypothetical protein